MNKINFNTMADFKRKAQVGRYIKGGYHDKMDDEEWREITKVQSNSIVVSRTISGKKKGSYFWFPKASDCKIVDGTLYIYDKMVRYNGEEMLANNSWLIDNIKLGRIKDEELERYDELVARYELGEEV